MLIKGCIAEDFTNYKKTSMFIIFPTCDFKCDKENGVQLCQNWTLSKQPAQEVSVESLVNLYIKQFFSQSPERPGSGFFLQEPVQFHWDRPNSSLKPLF